MDLFANGDFVFGDLVGIFFREERPKERTGVVLGYFCGCGADCGFYLYI